MKHAITARYKNVLLRPLGPGDLEALRVWRNDRELSRFLTPLPEITPEAQAAWFERAEAGEGELTFAIDETERLKGLAGSVALYNVSGKTAEFGRFLLRKEARGQNVGFIANTLALCVAFRVLGLEKITGFVHQENSAAIITYLKSGFTICGSRPFASGGYELEIFFERESFAQTRDFLGEIEIRTAKEASGP